METVTNPQINLINGRKYLSLIWRPTFNLSLPCRIKYHILIPILHFPVKGHLFPGNHIKTRKDFPCHKSWTIFGVSNTSIYHLWVHHKREAFEPCALKPNTACEPVCPVFEPSQPNIYRILVNLIYILRVNTLWLCVCILVVWS